MSKLHRLLLLLLIPGSLVAQPSPAPTAAGGPWLFAGFKADSKDGVYYALSPDGFHWTLANGGKPVLPPDSPGELMRDPFIQRAPDGSFRMVWTWSWNTPAVLGYSTSTDLVHWTPHRKLPVMANEPTAKNAWAPALYWEPAQKRWLIFWSSTIPGRFPGADAERTGFNHRIFSTTTTDFNSFTPAKLFFDPGYTVIDATLIESGGSFHLIFKDEREIPEEKHLHRRPLERSQPAHLRGLVRGRRHHSGQGRVPRLLRPLPQAPALRRDILP
jgi:hypothetical protein